MKIVVGVDGSEHSLAAVSFAGRLLDPDRDSVVLYYSVPTRELETADPESTDFALCVEDVPMRHQLTHERVQAADGWIEVPERPGLGVTLNEEFVAAHLVAESG